MAEAQVYDFNMPDESALNAKIKELSKLPELDSTKYGQLTDAYKELESAHHLRRQQYLADVETKKIRSVDPNQPAFSDASELLRASGLKRATLPSGIAARHEAMSQARPEAQTFDFNEPDSKAQAQGTSASEAKPGRSRGMVANALEFGKDLLTPRTTLSDLTSPEFLNNFALMATGGAAVGGLGGPGGMAAGGLAGALSAPLAFEGYKREVEKFTKMGYSPEEAQKAAALSSSVLGVASGLTGNIPPTSVRPTMPRPTPTLINQHELDALVKVREREKVIGSSLETRAYPVDPLSGMPGFTEDTGNVLVSPSLEPGVHTQPGKYKHNTKAGGIYHDAKGRKIGTPSVTQPGAYGEGDQMDLLGGFNVRGDADYLNRTSILGPGEQLNTDMDILRGQRAVIQGRNPLDPLSLEGSYALQHGPEQAADLPVPPRYQPETDRPVPGMPLKKYLMTPEESTALETTNKETIAQQNATANRQASPLERGAYPIQETVSKSGLSTHVGPRVDTSFVIPNEFTVNNTANGAVFPGLSNRVIQSDLDAMKKAGPVGEGMSSLLELAYTNRATGTARDMANAEVRLEQVLGKRSFGSRMIQGTKQLLAGENTFINGMSRTYNLSEAEQESLFNYMYTKRAMTPLNDRVRQAGEILFENGLYPASSDPGVRTLTVKNPFTDKDIPLGEPGMFHPQQPINPITVKAISNKQWELLYERRGGEKLGIGLEDYKKLIVKLTQHDPEVSAFKMKGLENMRLLDLEALGGSPYQWAKKLGYETDPFRATFRFNSLARLRGQFAQIEEPINNLLKSIPGDQAEASAWLRKSVDRALLKDGAYDLLENQTRFTRAMSRLTDITMLQTGALGNFSQIIYPIARGGLSATAKGIGSMFNATDHELIKQSGALFPSMLHELTVPSGALARWDSAVFRMYGLSKVDRFTRYFAGHIGHKYIEGVEQALLKNPTSRTHQLMIEELGGDSKALLEAGKLDDATRLKMIQRFANHTAGVTDVRGIPLYATNENPWFRLVNKYKTFAQANTAEVDRLIRNAPTGTAAVKRFVTLLAGAEVMGAGINTIRQGLQDAILGPEKNPTKTQAQWLIENAILGLGTVPGLLAVQFMNTPERMVTGLTAGPAGGLAGGLIEDLSATVEKGVGWRTFDTLSKRAPVVGPVLGPAVQREVRRESKQDAARSRAIREAGGIP